MVLERIDELVVKPRTGHGGHGVVIGPHAKREDLERTAAALRRAPELFIAQETVMLSRHPTVVTDGDLELRHVDLRPFAISSGDERPRAPRRAHPGRVRARRARRQLLPERWQQRHLGARMNRRIEKPSGRSRLVL